MWTTKTFKTVQALNTWIEKNDHKMQWQEIAVENAWGVMYRPLRIM